jgi:hypothetical protein
MVAAFDNDAFFNKYDDDIARLGEPAYPPNYRTWRLQSEEDGINWFHSEISNIVLAAWARYPNLLQVSHEKMLSETKSDPKVVDVAYSVEHECKRVHVAIGEFKRGLIAPDVW